jgi:C-terminal processing protease CtpA/Prc
LLLVAFLSLPPSARTDETAVSQTPFSVQQLDNLVAFTKLYGYIRFFHPSDEAAVLDWDRFAMYGSDRVLECKTKGELVAELYRLFGPIAPTVLIYGSKNAPGAKFGRFVPEDTVGLTLVTWQHLGVGLSPQSAYKSIRLNRRDNQVAVNAYGFGTITGSTDATRLRGKRITLRADVKTDRGSRAQLWLRVERAGGKRGFFDNMDDRPISLAAWNAYEITGKVDSDAVRIVFGCLLMGSGKAWLDDVRMFSGEAQKKEEIALENSDFEKDSPGVVPEAWSSISPGYTVEVTGATASTGEKSVLIRSAVVDPPPQLFVEHPATDEVAICNLPGGISARVPLTLFSDTSGTLPHADTKMLEELTAQMESTLPKTPTGRDRNVRLGGILIAWNVFQHFYPYFDLSGRNWGEELRPALEEAGRDTSAQEYLRTLQKFVAKLGDGHGGVWLRSEKPASFLPCVDWKWVEDKLVISAVFDTSGAVPAVGDVVLEVDGKNARKALEAEEVFVSAATPQWKRVRALTSLLTGTQNSILEIVIQNRNGEKRNFLLGRTLSMKEYSDLQQVRQRPTGKIGDGIVYINLSTTGMAEIDSLMPELANARGVICDLRGYPKGNHAFLSHLLTVPDTSTHWMAIPKVIYPDQARPAGYVYEGWQLQPVPPHINGKVAFLTSGGAVSYAESFLSYVENYKLAQIVGEPTAGTNGNVNPFNLPGGYQLTWTGMRVTKHDGSRHHGVGIQPTVTVHPTLKGIREGKDEQLEAALVLVSKTP